MQQTEFQTDRISQKKETHEQFIHRWGSAISEIIFDTSCNFFSYPGIDGFIAYRLVNHCAVVLGEPVCAAEKKTDLAMAFQNYCSENHLNFIYFIVSKQFAKWAIDNICKIMIGVCEEMIFDPFIDPSEGSKGFKLRNRIHHAQNLGIVVKEYLPSDLEIEKSILNVGKEWVQSRRGPQIYLGNLNFFEKKTNRRWFYLQDKEQKFIGMALLSKLDAYQGWLLKFLITVPTVPRGTSELLMLSILETLRSENCHYLTNGMIPADHLGETAGLNKIISWIVKRGFTAAKWFFRLEQRKTYWQKFHPRIENTYLLFSSPTLGIKELKALAGTMKMDLGS